mgnify:CR=1 FL=1
MFRNIFNTTKTVIYIDSKNEVKEIINEDELLSKYDITPLDSFKKKYKIIENENSDNYLYYFKFIFKNKTYFKVGITSTSLKKRYGKEHEKINEILYCKKIDACIKTEKKILNEFKDDLFPLKYFNSGYSEVFDKDVLQLDKN